MVLTTLLKANTKLLGNLNELSPGCLGAAATAKIGDSGVGLKRVDSNLLLVVLVELLVEFNILFYDTLFVIVEVFHKRLVTRTRVLEKRMLGRVDFTIQVFGAQYPSLHRESIDH